MFENAYTVCVSVCCAYAIVRPRGVHYSVHVRSLAALSVLYLKSCARGLVDEVNRLPGLSVVTTDCVFISGRLAAPRTRRPSQHALALPFRADIAVYLGSR